MLIVEYDPIYGLAMPDMLVMDMALTVISRNRNGADGYGTFVVGTEALVQAFRVQVVRGNISPDEITFRYKGIDIGVERCGAMKDWPAGFCAAYEDMLLELLDGKIDEVTN